MRKTSIDTYHEIKEKGLLSEKRLKVYGVLFEHGPCTGTELAHYYKKLYRSTKHSESIRNRLTELRDMGVVEELGTTICPMSERRVIQWDVTDKIPRKRSEIDRLKRSLSHHRKRVDILTRKIKRLEEGKYSANPKQTLLFEEGK